MFTGIIEELGSVEKIVRKPDGMEIFVKSKVPKSLFKRGNSIAVDGACLTVETYDAKKGVFSAHLVNETLDKTHFNKIEKNSLLNLEVPLRFSDFLHGHLVSGHVDAVATVKSFKEYLELTVPKDLFKFCPEKGSLTVNGVSLTIAKSKNNSVSLALIPETLKKTNLSSLKKGDQVNIEIDLLARYLEHYVRNRRV